jgi:hypothetical protein
MDHQHFGKPDPDQCQVKSHELWGLTVHSGALAAHNWSRYGCYVADLQHFKKPDLDPHRSEKPDAHQLFLI